MTQFRTEALISKAKAEKDDAGWVFEYETFDGGSAIADFVSRDNCDGELRVEYVKETPCATMVADTLSEVLFIEDFF